MTYALHTNTAEPAIVGCRHCGRAKVNRPRGLCWPCYHLPNVRDSYVSTSKFARRGTGHAGNVTPSPTTARPGTAEKLEVLERRAERGEMLFHPADASW